MTDIIYFGTHGSEGHYPKGIDRELSYSEYKYWCAFDNERWLGTIKKEPGFGYTYNADGDIYFTYYAFPWSIDDKRSGSHTDLFWRGEHTEEEIVSLIKSNPFLAKQFKLD